jgi:hypothetical protein
MSSSHWLWTLDTRLRTAPSLRHFAMLSWHPTLFLAGFLATSWVCCLVLSRSEPLEASLQLLRRRCSRILHEAAPTNVEDERWGNAANQTPDLVRPLSPRLQGGSSGGGVDALTMCSGGANLDENIECRKPGCHGRIPERGDIMDGPHQEEKGEEEEDKEAGEASLEWVHLRAARLHDEAWLRGPP